MPILPWSNMLSVGVQAIDQQHQTLVAILNELGDVVLGRTTAWNESEAMSRLVAYTETHFAYEEALMRQVGYAGLQAHAEEHRRLFQQVAELTATCSAGTAVDHQALLAFLRDWLTSHIMGTDRALGQALNRQDIR